MKRLHVSLLVLLLIPAQLSFGQTQSPNSAGPPIPEWVSWKVFQDSLAYYDKKAPQETRKMLKERLGLSTSRANKLLSSGNALLADLDNIDSEERSELRKRIVAPDPSHLSPGNGNQKTRELKTLKQFAAQDGLDKRTEGKRKAALVKHKDELLKDFEPLELARIEGFIRSNITPNIKVTKTDPAALEKTPGLRPSPPPSNATRTREVPPSLSKGAK